MTASTQFTASLPYFGYRQRNAFIDHFFYDTPSLTVEEQAKLSPLVDREGSIVVVPPSGSDRPIRHYQRALRFMNKEGSTIRAIAVAGVGSSVLGTAALARNVADALDADVAGVVSGYGLSDLLIDAFGGWFVFGFADRIRFAMEKYIERMCSSMPADKVGAEDKAAKAPWLDRASLPGDDDVVTLSEILLADLPKLEYLVGHSKGSLMVSYALQQYVDELEGNRSALYEQLSIITLGAVVGLPAAFKNVKQYLGALDWFGGANSSLAVRHERVPGASHHLNRALPYHMDVAALIRGKGAPRLLAKPRLEQMVPPLAPQGLLEEVAPAVPLRSVAAKPSIRRVPKKASEPPRTASVVPIKPAEPSPAKVTAPKVMRAASKKVAEPSPPAARSDEPAAKPRAKAAMPKVRATPKKTAKAPARPTTQTKAASPLKPAKPPLVDEPKPRAKAAGPKVRATPKKTAKAPSRPTTQTKAASPLKPAEPPLSDEPAAKPRAKAAMPKVRTTPKKAAEASPRPTTQTKATSTPRAVKRSARKPKAEQR